jgi:hypothetical protein
MLAKISAQTTLWSPRMVEYSKSIKDSKEIFTHYTFLDTLQTK